MTTRRRVAPVLVLSLATATLLVAPAPAAWATSCVIDPLATPTALADGSYTGSAEDFFERYDYALIGTVADKQTAARGGRTTVTFDVAGVLGRSVADPAIDVSLPDDGKLSGYGFEPGQAYFVPLQERNANGMTNFSHLCDPIAEVADPEAAFAQLSAVASARGIATASPVAETAPSSDASSRGMAGSALAWASAGGVLVLVLVGAVVVAVRRT